MRNKEEKEKRESFHFLGERVNAGEFALSNDDILELIDLAVEKHLLRIQ